MVPYIVFSLFMWNYFVVTILETGNITPIFTDFPLFSYSSVSPYEPRHEERGETWCLLSTRVDKKYSEKYRIFFILCSNVIIF